MLILLTDELLYTGRENKLLFGDKNIDRNHQRNFVINGNLLWGWL